MELVNHTRTNSFFHRLDPRSKMFLCATIMALSLLFNSPVFLVGLFLVVTSLIFLARVHHEFFERVKLLASTIFMAFILWSSFYRWSLFSSSGSTEAIFTIGPITLDRLGLAYGVSMLFRVLVMIGTPLLFFMTTTLSELVLAFVKLKIPYKVAFTLGLSGRLVPLLENEFKTIKQAQMARGLEIDKGGLVKRVKNHIPILTPLIFRSLELSDQMSTAMETKGFAMKDDRTFYKDIEMRRRDYLVVMISLLALALGIALRFFGVGIIA